MEVVHLESLDLPLYFHLSAQWRAECKAGPLLSAGFTGEHISAAQNRTNLGKSPLSHALLQGQQRLGSREIDWLEYDVPSIETEV